MYFTIIGGLPYYIEVSGATSTVYACSITNGVIKVDFSKSKKLNSGLPLYTDMEIRAKLGNNVASIQEEKSNDETASGKATKTPTTTSKDDESKKEKK